MCWCSIGSPSEKGKPPRAGNRIGIALPISRPDRPSDVESQIAWVSFLAWFRELSTIHQARFILYCQREIDDYEAGRIMRLEWQQALIRRAMSLPFARRET